MQNVFLKMRDLFDLQTFKESQIPILGYVGFDLWMNEINFITDLLLVIETIDRR